MATIRVDVAILAKAPVPGYAKTRLIPALGADGAAALQKTMIRRTVEIARAANLARVTLWCSPDPSHTLFAEMARGHGVELRRQFPGGLGARMLAAFRAQPPERPLLLIGTDGPALGVAHLLSCARSLHQGDDATFLPTEDGGYLLVGLRRALPTIFSGIAWSTPAVMAQTRRRLAVAGMRWSEPARLWDVDTPDDLRRLSA
ncbi:MAG: TIGR04282 family arsenosugar biosynthesis glycosyltransferase [Alphaproteobacteria bacterium]|nr:TIGR04282 family arsenosugar biosynthesis glycosyltransferase [Alphaproteobacteria bacterium]MCW5743028.1 TIGR04282 family arsenosugar biosynthesis glycosyltransferase [Alphaproteobacteria bacterium]